MANTTSDIDAKLTVADCPSENRLTTSYNLRHEERTPLDQKKKSTTSKSTYHPKQPLIGSNLKRSRQSRRRATLSRCPCLTYPTVCDNRYLSSHRSPTTIPKCTVARGEFRALLIRPPHLYYSLRLMLKWLFRMAALFTLLFSCAHILSRVGFKENA